MVAAEPVSVTSVDTVVEGVHFDLGTHSHADVGHKALAAALSDLAAMGAAAGEAYVALVVPAATGERDALSLVEAMEALAERTGVQVAGGDVVAGPALTVSVTVTGWAGDASELLYRDGASAGDLLGTSGELGGAGAGLLLLAGGGGHPRGGADREALLQRHRRPEPRLALGRAIAAAGASAAIDVSDGVATDAGHLARAQRRGDRRPSWRICRSRPASTRWPATPTRSSRARRHGRRGLRAPLHGAAGPPRRDRAGGPQRRRARSRGSAR